MLAQLNGFRPPPHVMHTVVLRALQVRRRRKLEISGIFVRHGACSGGRAEESDVHRQSTRVRGGGSPSLAGCATRAARKADDSSRDRGARRADALRQARRPLGVWAWRGEGTEAFAPSRVDGGTRSG